MFKIIKLKVKIFICFLVMDLLLASGAECQLNIYSIGAERKISSQDMDCLYLSEDYGRHGFNFQYPKLIDMQGRDPLIAFLDVKSTKLIVAEVIDNENKIMSVIPGYGRFGWEKWPIIFLQDRKIYLAIYSGYYPAPEEKRIKLYLLDRETGQLILQDEKIFSRDTRCESWGIVPFRDQFMLIGSCNYICLRYLPSVLMGGDPTYYQNASFLLDGTPKPVRQPIEEQGCHNVFKQSYGVSEVAGIQSAWIRETKGLSLKHDEIIYYSTNRDGTKWSHPTELYAVKDTEKSSHLNDLSLASAGNAAFVLWQNMTEGIFFSEIKNGGKSEPLRLSNFKRAELSAQDPLPAASTIKVASDVNNNAYALWARNSGKDYKLYLKARIGMQWTSEVIINQGPGYLKLPDMKVDEKGNIHITYIKSINPNEPRGKYGCFYMKLEPKGRAGQKESLFSQ
jgi:hypothetical protein